jgi:hypothetical protein
MDKLTVSSVTVAILVDVILGDGLSPTGAALELDVVDVYTGVDDEGGDTLSTT